MVMVSWCNFGKNDGELYDYCIALRVDTVILPN